MRDVTTIQVTPTVRTKVKQAAAKRAKKMGITSLSMNDYLSLIADNE